MGAVAVLVGALQLVGVASSAVVALVLGFGGLLFKRIIEESIAAEELNTILAMEQVVSTIAASPTRSAASNRLRTGSWTGAHCASTRIDGDRSSVIYHGGHGLLAASR